MGNVTQFSYFTLTAYFDSGSFRYIIFTIIMVLYVFIVCANILLIVVICMNRSLHEPMYLLICSLFVNGLIGSSSLFPSLLVQMLSDIHTVSASLCFLQIFFLYSYGGVEYLNLAIMAYDRYLAICCPLQYNSHMTSNNITMLISLIWIIILFLCFIMILLSSSLQLCGNIINKVYCDNYSITKLACSDTTVNGIYGLIITALSVFAPLIIIIFSYIKILKVCATGSKKTRQKALSTCTPHLASLLNFSFGACFEVIQNRFNMNHVPIVLRILLSLYWLTCQPLLNPLLYGLNLTKIRIICKNMIFTAM